MAAIGILGGMGPQASNKLYELLINKTARYTNAAVDEDYPEIVLINVPAPDFISDKSKLILATNMLIERTKSLEQAGCTINGIACNTAYLLLPELQASTKVPFLSLPKLVDARVRGAGYSRIGLLATPTTLGSTLYDKDVTSAQLIRPDTELALLTEKVIYKQLANKLQDSERQAFKLAVESFMSIKGLDAVILGCTELPLVYGDDSPSEILDTLQILSDELLAVYYSESTRINV